MKMPDDLKKELLNLFFWAIFLATVMIYADNAYLWLVRNFAYREIS